MGWGAQGKDFFICFLLLQRGSCVEHGEILLEQSVFLISFFAGSSFNFLQELPLNIKYRGRF